MLHVPPTLALITLSKTCILKLGPDDDLDEVETCRPCKLNS